MRNVLRAFLSLCIIGVHTTFFNAHGQESFGDEFIHPEQLTFPEFIKRDGLKEIVEDERTFRRDFPGDVYHIGFSFQIGENGGMKNIRKINSSGTEEFDQLMVNLLKSSDGFWRQDGDASNDSTIVFCSVVYTLLSGGEYTEDELLLKANEAKQIYIDEGIRNNNCNKQCEYINYPPIHMIGFGPIRCYR